MNLDERKIMNPQHIPTTTTGRKIENVHEYIGLLIWQQTATGKRIKDTEVERMRSR